MKITQFTDYSLRLLLFLADNPERVISVREAAEFYDISAEHLKKVVRHLADEGYVETMRGKKGGLKLARDPQSINVGYLVRRSENLHLLPCHDLGDTCPIQNCKLALTVNEALEAFLAVLDRKSLADLR